MKNILIFLYIIAFFILTAIPAPAHRVVVFAWIDGDTVFTESQFPDGRKITHAPIRVFDGADMLLLEGITDDEGAFSFKIPATDELRIVLDAGMGHQGHWRLSAQEIRDARGPDTTESPEVEPPPAPVDRPELSDPSPVLSGVDEKKLEEIIKNVLDEKLQPINRSLARLSEPPTTLKDIMGGIGYILGLMGVAAYVASRKKSS